MDKPRQNDHLGVNKSGKNIRKSPLHQPNFAANANNAATTRPQAQSQVYNISKNDFRSIVQQLTGSPSRESLPRPPQNNPPKPQNTRLQRIRPTPLTEIKRPAMAPPQPHPPQPPFPHGILQPMMIHGDQFSSNTAESPISEYMRYLQSSLGDSGTSGNQMHPSHQHQPYIAAQFQLQPPQPQPHMMTGLQPRINLQGQIQPSQYHQLPGLVPSPVPRNLPSPRFNAPVPLTPTLPSPRLNQLYGGFPSPRYNGFGPLHSPASQFLLPSPTGYPKIFSPRSPYPLLSPGVQYPQPLTPNFSFSQISQSGSFVPGAGPGSVPPQPPGLMFPLSPVGFFPIPSPRWNDY